MLRNLYPREAAPKRELIGVGVLTATLICPWMGKSGIPKWATRSPRPDDTTLLAAFSSPSHFPAPLPWATFQYPTYPQILEASQAASGEN